MTFFPPCADPRCATHIINDNFVAHVKDVHAGIDGDPVDDMPKHVVRVSGSNPLIFVVDAGPIDPASGYGGILPASRRVLADAGAVVAGHAQDHLWREDSES